MRHELTPQLRKILNHIDRTGYITPRAAIIDHGIATLSRRMCDLKELGYDVRSEMHTNPSTGQRYARYYVERPLEVAA